MPPKKTRTSPAAATPAKRQRRPADPPASALADIASSPPPPASPSALTGYASLPTDIMQLVLVLIPLRPRLLVAALVCRRWNAAARRATTALPGHLKLAAYSAACKHLPIVTSLCVTQPLPPAFDVFRDPLAPLSTLTSLTIRMDSPSSVKVLAELLAKNGNSLTSLGVGISRCTAPVVAALADAQLPALRTLRLHWPLWDEIPDAPRMTALMTRLSTQLQSLSFKTRYAINIVNLCDKSAGAFAQLKHYSTTVSWLAEIEPLVARAPQLCSVSCTANSPLAPALLHRVSHLNLDYGWNIALLEQVITSSTLTSLGVHGTRGLDTKAWQFKHIRTVRVDTVSSTRFDVFYHFPNLTSLSLMSGGSLSVLLALLNAFVASPAPLRYLFIGIREDAKASQRDAFKELLPRVEERGLECLHICLSEGIWLTALQAIAKKLLWLELIVELSSWDRCMCAH